MTAIKLWAHLEAVWLGRAICLPDRLDDQEPESAGSKWPGVGRGNFSSLKAIFTAVNSGRGKGSGRANWPLETIVAPVGRVARNSADCFTGTAIRLSKASSVHARVNGGTAGRSGRSGFLVLADLMTIIVEKRCSDSVCADFAS